MSMSRKRRHSKAFPAQDDDDDEQSPPLGDTESFCAHESSKQDDTEKLEKEPEIWDAFREEHYEAIEQLPLSLHRQLILMKELDQQAHGGRRQMTKRSPVDGFDSMATIPRTPTAMSISPEHAEFPLTTREMLSHIGHLSEELLRASEEKVNLAQAGYDSVDRHIRLLDQAIKEQEASISSGVRSGTHPAPILLPDLVVPRWARPTRVTHSPMPAIYGAADGENEEENLAQNGGLLGVSSDEPDELHAHSQKKGKKGTGKWAKKKTEREPYVSVPPRRGRVRSLKLTVSTPSRPAMPPPGLIIDPNEPRYCYCNQVSFGEMIACDGKGCKREWFHWDCVGLKKAPLNKSKWYCRNCSR